MSLPMTRPYPHPKTGTYWVRKVVPADLRATVGKRELVQSLRTKDPKEARAKAPAVIAEFEAVLAAARRASMEGAPEPTRREVAALAGEWYRQRVGAYGDQTIQDLHWEVAIELFGDLPAVTDPRASDEMGVPDALNQQRAEGLLRRHGFSTDLDSVNHLAISMARAERAFFQLVKRRSEDDWSPDPNLPKFPILVSREAPEAAPKLMFQALVAAWAAESGTTGKALYDRERTANLLSTFLGHDDAARVTADDVVRWKEARLAAGRSTKTVANDIGELRPIWSWGRRNRKLIFAENPFAGLAPRTKRQSRRPRGPYTEDEARQVLTAARAETDPSLRWLPWVLCFTGARLGEVTQTAKEDIQREGGGPWFIHIHNEGVGRTLKTAHSERMVPLHSALIAEGFLRYVEGLLAGSSLFGDLIPDKFGTLKGTATKKHGRWVRRTVGITDKTKDPAHAWRHRFEDQARRAGVPQNVTDGLMGHLNAMNESEGCGRGFRFMPDATAPWLDKMASPFQAPIAAPSGPLQSAA